MAIQHEEPYNIQVTLYLVVAAFFTFFVGLVVYIYFNSVAQDEIHAKIELAPTPELDNLRHHETELLGQDIDGQLKDSYQAVETTHGIYRIPIQRAMELEAQGSWRRNLLPPAGGAHTPAPTPHASPKPH